MYQDRFNGFRAARTAIFGASLLALSAGWAAAQTKGGDLVVVQSSNPPSLDAMVTSSQASRNVNMNIYEQLYGFNEKVEPIPVLAEGVKISEDGLTYVFTLRQGVKFHNGKVMDSEDVRASLVRFKEIGAQKTMLAGVSSIEATGPLEVTLKMEKPFPGFLEAFASPRVPAVIIPASESAKPANEIEIIGTGPFKFVEYVPDSHVKLARFDDYVADTRYEAMDGVGGKKTAWLDTVTFRVISEPGAAVAALETGEAHLLEQIPVPTARRMESNADVKLYENMPWSVQTLVFNLKDGPAKDVKFRQAVQAGVDLEEIMGISTEGLFNLYHGWMYEGSTYDAGDVGKDRYNTADLEKAKALLKESSYAGEPFSILTDSQIPEHSKTAVVLAEQMKAMGINAVINQVDWPTALKIRLQDEGWHGWTLSMGIEPFLGPEALVSVLSGSTTHFREPDAEVDALYAKLTETADLAERKTIFAQIQERLIDQAPILKMGEKGMMQASRASVEGFKPYRFPRVYDVWLQN